MLSFSIGLVKPGQWGSVKVMEKGGGQMTHGIKLNVGWENKL
jgi:hypothetical protein